MKKFLLSSFFFSLMLTLALSLMIVLGLYASLSWLSFVLLALPFIAMAASSTAKLVEARNTNDIARTQFKWYLIIWLVIVLVAALTGFEGLYRISKLN